VDSLRGDSYSGGNSRLDGFSQIDIHLEYLPDRESVGENDDALQTRRLGQNLAKNRAQPIRVHEGLKRKTVGPWKYP